MQSFTQRSSAANLTDYKTMSRTLCGHQWHNFSNSATSDDNGQDEVLINRHRHIDLPTAHMSTQLTLPIAGSWTSCQGQSTRLPWIYLSAWSWQMKCSIRAGYSNGKMTSITGYWYSQAQQRAPQTSCFYCSDWSWQAGVTTVQPASACIQYRWLTWTMFSQPLWLYSNEGNHLG